MALFQYSFATTDLVLAVPDAAGVYDRFKVTGFPSGENLINVTRRAPIATTSFGAYGDMVVSMHLIKAADLVFPLLMNAPENKKLQDYVNYAQSLAGADGDLIYPIHGKLTDNMGNDEVTMHNGMVLAIPSMSRGQSVTSINWVVTFEKGIFLRGDGDDATNLGV